MAGVMGIACHIIIQAGIEQLKRGTLLFAKSAASYKVSRSLKLAPIETKR